MSSASLDARSNVGLANTLSNVFKLVSFVVCDSVCVFDYKGVILSYTFSETFTSLDPII